MVLERRRIAWAVGIVAAAASVAWLGCDGGAYGVSPCPCEVSPTGPQVATPVVTDGGFPWDGAPDATTSHDAGHAPRDGGSHDTGPAQEASRDSGGADTGASDAAHDAPLDAAPDVRNDAATPLDGRVD
jgi:hypothetical protein